ncbi:MAG: hypothetical protein GF331_18940 [Chitinivibrionales bacterium]|nr:hypothetical protein [Chitinivibrionales bacterium]
MFSPTSEVCAMRMTAVASTCLICLACMFGTHATVYYVRPGGNDSRDGTSVQNAWATLQPVRDHAWSPGFGAGDSILFEGGATITSPVGIYFQCDRTSGTAASPVTLTSYGTGRATVEVQADHFISIWAPSMADEARPSALGVRITNLHIRGNQTPRPGPKNADGVQVWNSSERTLDFLHVEDCEISGFAGDGINTGRDNNARGRLTNVVMRNVTAHDNPGASGVSPHTGTGIVVGGARGALVEYCTAFRNGVNNDNPGGPIGIWFWDCSTSTIQHCESYENRTTRGDGGGFDIDGGCQGCVIQYCYSHDNAGAGFLFAQFGGAASGYGPLEGNVVRYCISENDGRKGSFGGFHFWGASWSDRVGPNDIYHNTVYMGETPDNGSPSCVGFLGSNMQGVRIRNNVFVAANGHRMIDAPTAFDTSRVLFQGNCYHAMPGTDIRIKWGGTTCSSVAQWRGQGQERLSGADAGLETDPLLADPGNGGTVGDPTQLANLGAYRLQESSPLVDAGLDLPAQFGLDVGSRDFYGGPAPVLDGYDIGAHEYPHATGTGDFQGLRAPDSPRCSGVRLTLSGRIVPRPSAARAAGVTVLQLSGSVGGRRAAAQSTLRATAIGSR